MECNIYSKTVKIGGAIIAGIVTTGMLYPLVKKFYRSSSHLNLPKKWIKVGTVSKLIIYPIKSCVGIEVNEAIVSEVGLKGSADADVLRDRVFMIVDYRYVFQTQRTQPRLVLVKVDVQCHQITVSGPGMESLTVSVPENILKNKRSCRVQDDNVREVLDCGDQIGLWLDTFLEGKGHRLVYHQMEKTQRVRTPLQRKFPDFVAEDKGTFQDQTSQMLMSEESVEYLNTLLKNPVTFKNFRPTILINGVPEPFAEENFGYVRIGDKGGPILKIAVPCARCKVTTVNPDTGEYDTDGQPLEMLTKQKRSFGEDRLDKLIEGKGVIGIRMGLHQLGCKVKVGDPVYCAIFQNR